MALMGTSRFLGFHIHAGPRCSVLIFEQVAQSHTDETDQTSAACAIWMRGRRDGDAAKRKRVSARQDAVTRAG